MIRNTKEILDYYFKNPSKNSNKEMAERFNICTITFSRILSKELKRRRENSMVRRFINKNV
mgnify:FL=1|tara:strand:+ start:3658 stop:3840 length:183 start_codon:yes stop_codon:yes gene_type:complete